MGKQYVVESDFEDLHGNPAEEQDLEVDFKDSDNPIIRAARGEREDDDWTPPKAEEKDSEEDDEVELEEDDDEELDDDEVEEDDEEESDDDSEEDEEEEDDYSKRVQKRIDRERELRKKAESRLSKIERKFELREAKDSFTELKAEKQAEIDKLLAKKEEAYEEGDSKAQAKFDDQILEIRAEIAAKKSELERREKELEQEPADTDSGDGPPEPGRKWLQKYPEFHSNKRFQDAVLQADKMVANQGFDKNTEEYYEKIEEIVAVTFPQIVKQRRAKVTTKKRKRSETARKRKPAVGAGGKPGSGKTKRRRGKVRLTKGDQAQMRVFNLDPRNPTHVKEWLANKTED